MPNLDNVIALLIVGTADAFVTWVLYTHEHPVWACIFCISFLLCIRYDSTPRKGD